MSDFTVYSEGRSVPAREDEGLREAEIAFTNVVNSRSASSASLAVPYRRDVERIWEAIKPFLTAPPSGSQPDTGLNKGVLSEAILRHDANDSWPPNAQEFHDKGKHYIGYCVEAIAAEYARLSGAAPEVVRDEPLPSFGQQVARKGGPLSSEERRRIEKSAAPEVVRDEGLFVNAWGAVLEAPVAETCRCTADTSLGAGSTCTACGHRDHGKSGCRAAPEAQGDSPATPREEPGQ